MNNANGIRVCDVCGDRGGRWYQGPGQEFADRCYMHSPQSEITADCYERTRRELEEEFGD